MEKTELLRQATKKQSNHPYLAGNFAPIQTTVPLTSCSYEGTIPCDLAGGEYIRNGGNPLTNENLGREAHWFDGDGMLSGVLFDRAKSEKGHATGHIQPRFVNKFLVTDVYSYALQNKSLRKPVLPSIATLVSPLTSWFALLWAIARSVLLTIVSRSRGRTSITKISVANTSVIYHDGRALATCESGPPLRFALPGLETVGWFNGRRAENEPSNDHRSGYGGDGALSFMRQWTTAHPRVDSYTKELLSFHSTFAKPYVRYSIVGPSEPQSQSSEKSAAAAATTTPGSLFEMEVPGIAAPRMMHDFGVSRGHTIIMDLPLSLDPMNQLSGMPSLCYDTRQKSRFGVFPRYAPSQIQWFETNPCLIFHTVNCWDEPTTPRRGTSSSSSSSVTVNLLANRMTSSSMIFRAGNLPTPASQPIPPEYNEEEQCRLYYYTFPLSSTPGSAPVHIGQQWALSAIPFEFATMCPHREMQEATYVYGCSSSESFTVALGKAAKIDYLVKMNVKHLIAKGKAQPPQSIKGCVDTRSLQEISARQRLVAAGESVDDDIILLPMPKGWYAQEPCFVPRSNQASEDDGWLLTYVFDESQIDVRSGQCVEEARSELWIIDARNLKDIVAKIKLPQRVPYGLHGSWFTEEDIQHQKPFERVREVECERHEKRTPWTMLRDGVESWLG